jgi:oligopeptide transport system ATP-binding protein
MLEIKDLKVEFPSVKAVRGVSLQVAAGETMGIVGESGSGKSMTAHAILGLIPPPGRVVSGSIKLLGEELLTMTPAQWRTVRREKLGVIFQDPMSSLNPTLRISRQIGEALKVRSRDRVLQLLEMVGIPDPEVRISQYPHELSVGMRQRVMIAIALASEPDLLIADEPTTALDVTIQKQILDLIQDLQRKLGMSTILISHDLAVVAGRCDRVIVMYGGKIVEEAPVRQLFTAPKHPYTRALLSAIPRIDADRSKPLEVIAGRPPDLSAPPPGCPFTPRCPHAMAICAQQMPPPLSGAACWLQQKEQGIQP